MSISIKLRRLDDAVVLELAGRLSVFDKNLRDVVQELAEFGERNFIMNLAGVDYVDSAGLGHLCSIYTLLQAHGGRMTLSQASPRVLKLLNTTKLDTVFKLTESTGMDSYPVERSTPRFACSQIGRG